MLLLAIFTIKTYHHAKSSNVTINIGFVLGDSDSMSVGSSRSNLYTSHALGGSKTSITSGNLYGGQLSATESSREDERHDETESDKSSTGGVYAVSFTKKS